jgi:hypothetical protein
VPFEENDFVLLEQSYYQCKGRERAGSLLSVEEIELGSRKKSESFEILDIIDCESPNKGEEKKNEGFTIQAPFSIIDNYSN